MREVGDHFAISAATFNIPNVRAFNFSADTNATGAENATVVVTSEALMRGVNGECGIAIGETDVSEAELLRESLEFAVAVGNADGADVISLGEEEFEYGAAMPGDSLGSGGDFHAFFNAGDAGREQAVLAFDFNEAEAACADIAETIEVAEGGNVDAIFTGDIEDGLVGPRADVFAVDDESFDFSGSTHAITSAA